MYEQAHPAAADAQVRAIEARSLRAATLELDVITSDLAGRPGVKLALVGADAPGGAIQVVSAAGSGGEADPRLRAFMVRAVESGNGIIEAFAASPGDIALAVGAPVQVACGARAALCAGLTAPLPEAAGHVERIDAYARLASRWLGETQRSGPLDRVRRADPSGCLTYAALLQDLQRQIDRCERQQLDLTCCFVDLAGRRENHRQRLLGDAAAALRTATEPSAVIGRYGRWRFVVGLPGVNIDLAYVLADLMRAAIRTSVPPRGLNPAVGIAAWRPGSGLDRLLADADAALANARRPSGPKVVVAPFWGPGR